MNPSGWVEPKAQASGASLRGLRVSLSGGTKLIEDVDLELRPGQILGLVGESGSGKSTTALAMLGYSTPGAEIRDGVLRIGESTLAMDSSVRHLRGSAVSYVPQNPGRALNPSMRVGDCIGDVLRTHLGRDVTGVKVLEALSQVGLPGSDEFARRYPHQLSGGQQQRVCIAMALCCRPDVVILDEPTTGLDVVTQGRVLDLLRALCDQSQTAMLYVTHDLAVVAQLADRVAVMYAGEIVEQGPTTDLLSHPFHPYTRGLLSSTPDHVRPQRLEPLPGLAVAPGERPVGCHFHDRCQLAEPGCSAEHPALVELDASREVRCHHWQSTKSATRTDLSRPTRADTAPVLVVDRLSAQHGAGDKAVRVASEVSLTIRRGECVALVGESGSGKTTIARVLAGLHPPSSGAVMLAGEPMNGLASRRSIDQRRRLQIVFQNPSDALNPRHTCEESISRPARLLRGASRSVARREARELMDLVRLPARVLARYPTQLSGGERQRVAIARALAARPEVVICDEITSALDVSVQAAVLDLLDDLRTELGLALLFITHDLGVVAAVADQVLVLESGRIAEQGSALDVLNNPGAPYSKRLVQTAPSISRATHNP